ncbi:hypothetical protein [Algoriphagus resistens]|uniref:hypothetical protein n=1 Tax=Algoriphagus resistens TaxID=1750590 RepID=UPI000716AB5C|nr:hypothetical protein [Algoriphagus resistens]
MSRKLEIIFPVLFGLTRRIRVNLPAKWNELTQKQLIPLAGLLHSSFDSVYEFRIKALMVLTRLNLIQMLALGERIIDLYPFIQFLEDENELTQNKIESITIGYFAGKTLYGPVGNFETLTADEWTEADDAYLEFRRESSDQALDRFIAILFRERVLPVNELDNKRDPRIAYSEGSEKHRLPLIQKIPRDTKLAVILWWTGCRKEWEDVFERVFSAKGEGPESFGWQETILKLSGTVFGNHRDTQRTYMYKLMLQMEVTLKDEEYQKQKEDSMKRKSRM